MTQHGSAYACADYFPVSAYAHAKLFSARQNIRVPEYVSSGDFVIAVLVSRRPPTFPEKLATGWRHSSELSNKGLSRVTVSDVKLMTSAI